MEAAWPRCLERLEAELPAEEIHAWLRPLQAEGRADGLTLYAPNAFVVDQVREHYLPRIRELVTHFSGGPATVSLAVGSLRRPEAAAPASSSARAADAAAPAFSDNLDGHYTFENFVEGRSNQLGRAAALQVAQNPGKAYNPLLLYGGSGLGKTHLMYAAGNLMRQNNPGMRVLYLRSEQFFSAMMKSLQDRSMDQFKRQFQQVDALLIDDIQFFAGKNTTQEEFFHTFNALFDGKQQIILTCDRYPREVENLETRLKTRLTWGLSVAIEPPDFETRAAIIAAKAVERGIKLPDDVAYLIAKRMRSNVRDLEGALNTLSARSNFMARPITADFAQFNRARLPIYRGREVIEAPGQLVSLRSSSRIEYSLTDVTREPSYNPDPREECTRGILFFVTRREAAAWSM
jgi:chromosomal replication initiator protein